MDIIPFNLHITILLSIVVYAVYRRSKSPLILASMYTAFFLLSNYTNNLTLEYDVDYPVQSLLAVVLTWSLVNYASRMKRCLFVDGFLYFSYLAIISILLMLLAYIYLTGYQYIFATGIFLQLQLWYQIADIIMMIGVINGDTARDLHINIRQFSNSFNRVFSSRYSVNNKEAQSWSPQIKRTSEYR